jgi:hypothetical protein
MGAAEVELLELLEEPRQVLGRDARPLIGHRDRHLIRLQRGRHRHPRARRRELDGIGQEVRHHLDHPVEVHRDGRQPGGNGDVDGDPP